METGKVDSGALNRAHDDEKEWMMIAESDDFSGEWMVVTGGMNAFSMSRHKPETTSADKSITKNPMRVRKRSQAEEAPPKKSQPLEVELVLSSQLSLTTASERASNILTATIVDNQQRSMQSARQPGT
jgi:hypothetical protein